MPLPICRWLHLHQYDRYFDSHTLTYVYMNPNFHNDRLKGVFDDLDLSVIIMCFFRLPAGLYIQKFKDDHKIISRLFSLDSLHNKSQMYTLSIKWKYEIQVVADRFRLRICESCRRGTFILWVSLLLWPVARTRIRHLHFEWVSLPPWTIPAAFASFL